ncbi:MULTISPECIES: type II secretion system protein [Cryobacterium]|uniref:Type II secretion system protein n=1 Tax=Cryobacterium breve TaxID=1259258 RepID=A0ABY2J3Q8_9MICO|nr:MULTISPECIES: type II secretion system protein [Cryobacterium]TFC91821.1 type II secretion system protein [Cryobacterium sp. TmT3-12]TFC98371.1 type II secretion system protein [Cryobacterium breve]
MSLVELLVSMMLLGLVLSMVTGLFISVSKSVSIAQATDERTRTGSNAVNEMSRVIRAATTLKVTGALVAAPAFRFAGREAVVLYSSVDVNAAADLTYLPPKPTLVRFEIASGNRELVESRWTATAHPSGTSWIFAPPASPASPAASTPANSTRILGGPLATMTLPLTPTDPPLFSYYDALGVEIPLPATGGLSASDLDLIKSVQIAVRLPGTASSPDGALAVVSIVAPPNLKTP